MTRSLTWRGVGRQIGQPISTCVAVLGVQSDYACDEHMHFSELASSERWGRRHASAKLLVSSVCIIMQEVSRGPGSTFYEEPEVLPAYQTTHPALPATSKGKAPFGPHFGPQNHGNLCLRPLSAVGRGEILFCDTRLRLIEVGTRVRTGLLVITSIMSRTLGKNPGQ